MSHRQKIVLKKRQRLSRRNNKMIRDEMKKLASDSLYIATIDAELLAFKLRYGSNWLKEYYKHLGAELKRELNK